MLVLSPDGVASSAWYKVLLLLLHVPDALVQLLFSVVPTNASLKKPVVGLHLQSVLL